MLALRIDKYLNDRLSDTCTELRVTAVFNKVISGYIDDEFVTLLSPDKKLLPASVVLSSPLSELPAVPGKRLSISRAKTADIVLGDGTAESALTLPNVRIDKMRVLKVEISDFLEACVDKSMGMPRILSEKNTRDADSGYMEMDLVVKYRIQELLSSLRKKEPVLTKSILGYGSGLTPSTDDFLLGLMSVLQAAADQTRHDLLSEYILKHVCGTTEVSRHMLKYAVCEGLYPEILSRLFQAYEDFETHFADFMKHGATSGLDLLSGIAAGLYIILEDAYER